MGYRGYNQAAAQLAAQQFQQQKREEIFNRGLSSDMDGKEIKLRECRDSEANPITIPVILALDETGSMGYIPETLIKGDFVHAMSIMKQASPKESFSMLFMGIGDHFTDRAPLQLGQFENSDEEMNQWLKKLWLEGGGGGNGGESYALAWIFAGHNVVSDHWEKRRQKGILITIGDEPIHMNGNSVRVGGVTREYSAEQAVAKAKEQFEVYHIHCNFSSRLGPTSIANWKHLLGERFFEAEKLEDIKKFIASITVSHANTTADVEPVEEPVKSDPHNLNIL